MKRELLVLVLLLIPVIAAENSTGNVDEVMLPLDVKIDNIADRLTEMNIQIDSMETKINAVPQIAAKVDERLVDFNNKLIKAEQDIHLLMYSVAIVVLGIMIVSVGFFMVVIYFSIRFAMHNYVRMVLVHEIRQTIDSNFYSVKNKKLFNKDIIKKEVGDNKDKPKKNIIKKLIDKLTFRS